MSFLSKLFSKPNKNEKIALDIGRGSVKLMVFSQNKKGKVLSRFLKKDISRFGVFDGKDFEFDVVKGPLLALWEQIPKDFRENAFLKLSFAPDILKAKVFSFSIERKTPERKITEKEQEEFYERLAHLTQREVIKEGSLLKVLLLEKKSQGYALESLLEASLKKIDFLVLGLFFKKEYVGFFEKIINLLRPEKDNWEVFHKVELFPSLIQKGLFLDIGAGNTLVAFVKNQKLVFVEDFQIGGESWLRYLSKSLNERENFVKILLEKFSQGKLSQGVRERIEALLSHPTKNWLDNLKEKLKNKKSEVFFENVYLMGGAARNPLVIKFLEEIFKKENICFFPFEALKLNKKPKVPFGPDDLSSLLLLSHKARFEEILNKKNL